MDNNKLQIKCNGCKSGLEMFIFWYCRLETILILINLCVLNDSVGTTGCRTDTTW